MDDSAPVGVLQRIADLDEHADGPGRVEPRAALEQLAEVDAIYELHDEVLAGPGSRVQDRDDVGVREPRGQLRLAAEPPQRRRVVDEPACDDLHGDVALEPFVQRPVDVGHPAHPDGLQQPIARAEPPGGHAQRCGGHVARPAVEAVADRQLEIRLGERRRH
jgi:hypothetical protein